jgi:hypothetical protein
LKNARLTTIGALAAATLGCVAYARTGSLGPCLSDSAVPIFVGGAGAMVCGLATILALFIRPGWGVRAGSE